MPARRQPASPVSRDKLRRRRHFEQCRQEPQHQQREQEQAEMLARALVPRIKQILK